MMYDKTFDYVTENEVHLKALGIERVSMSENEPIRWDLVTEVKTGGSYRLGFSTSQYVVAKHPSGIDLTWRVELEPRSENGTGILKLNIDAIKEIIDNAPEQAADSVRQWLNDAISEVSKHIDDLEKGLQGCKEVRSLFEESLAQ
tara:strand:- start:42017 stop:42451 length:435 start_codon:yes stop_codon:yes gene_type:complete